MTLKKHGAHRDKGFYPKDQGETILPMAEEVTTEEVASVFKSQTKWPLIIAGVIVAHLLALFFIFA